MVAEKPRDILRRDWYSGTIRLPQGKLLNYVHGGYGSTYEQDVLLHIELGVLVETRVRAVHSS